MAALVIGLGNPGGEYTRTRHNVGWMCLDELERRGRFGRERREGPARIREGSLEGFDVVTARPQTYMNVSGRAGVHLTERFGVRPGDVVVVHDEADLPLGRIRVKEGGRSAGHRGVQSLIDSWRTQDFVRVRIGVGHPGATGDLVDHVLDRFDREERERLPEIIARAADAVITIIRDGAQQSMTLFNRAADV
ncbi:MAG: aminoacyl-tRNA hydrolase [Candidatus Dormibacteraeota bacterium]|nr:aminoacyl-tRNA hydrolase [Candidatus Dormibacteraeota bacterium]